MFGKLTCYVWKLNVSNRVRQRVKAGRSSWHRSLQGIEDDLVQLY